MESSPSTANSGLVFVNFNQDFGCFVAVTSDGFRIFNADPLRQNKTECKSFLALAETVKNDGENSSVYLGPTISDIVDGKARVVKAEMLFRCNPVALVVNPLLNSMEAMGASNSPINKSYRVVIWDDLKQRSVIELEFAHEVKAVKLRRDKIIVVLPQMIKVYTFTPAPTQLHVFDTVPNHKGLCALSSTSDKALLAFPVPQTISAIVNNKISSTGIGRVQIVDLANPDNQPVTIVAHDTRLSNIQLNIQGTRLATASDKGTLIRIFDTGSGKLLSELRRGTQAATIYSVNFSADSSLVRASSSHGTIHIFATEDSSKNKTSSIVTSAADFFGSASNKLLPKYFTSEWSFSKIEVPGGTRCICAFGANNNTVLAVCDDSSYHKFVYDEQKRTFIREVYQMFLEPDIETVESF